MKQVTQKQIEAVLGKHINIPALAKEFKQLGFGTYSKIETISSIQDFIALRTAPDRIIKLPDGWLRDKYLSILAGKNYDFSPEDLEKHIPWEEAEEYSAKYGIQASPEELMTLLDTSKYNPAIVEGAKILNLKLNDWYWTRQTYPGNPGCARVVGFKIGDVSDDYKYYKVYVRPVRLSQ
jgi:hypothetical protein